MKLSTSDKYNASVIIPFYKRFLFIRVEDMHIRLKAIFQFIRMTMVSANLRT